MNETDMRLLVLSDSHGDCASLREAVEAEQPDRIVHLGDHIADAQALRLIYPGIPLYCVCGNTDDPFLGKVEELVQVGGFRLLLTHGHRYHVKSGLAFLTAHARELQADAVLFGHTHRAFLAFDGVQLCNPGSASRRVSAHGAATYGVIELKNGALIPRIRLLGSE